jgi:hypothetical protein
MGLPVRGLLFVMVVFAVFGPFSAVRAQEERSSEPVAEAAPAERRPDAPSMHVHVTDLPGVWQALRETRLRQSIEALFAIPFVAEDETLAGLRAGLETIAERGGIEPTLDSLLGENTHELRLVVFEEEDPDDPTAMPYVLEARMASRELAGAVAEVLQANLGADETTIRAVAESVTITNAPEWMIQDRMADWRAAIVEEAFAQAILDGAQVRFFAQPARDEEPGSGDRISAGHLRVVPGRIDLAMQALPAREDGVLRVPVAEGLANLDRFVVLAEKPHVLSLAYHGAAAMLDNASRDSERSRGRRIVAGLTSYTGASVEELLEAFGENATLAVNNLGVRGMFDYSVGVTGAWEVRDREKAAQILETLKETHRANLTRDAERYGRSTDGVRFREEEHRGLTIWSAPLMIFPLQPSSPPTLNVTLTDEVLLFATSRTAMHGLIGRYLDGSGDASALERARVGQDLPREVHSLGTVDFAGFAEVFRAAVPVLVMMTQGGQEAQVFGRALADVFAALGHGQPRASTSRRANRCGRRFCWRHQTPAREGGSTGGGPDGGAQGHRCLTSPPAEPIYCGASPA